jgi:hypothetical protein
MKSEKEEEDTASVSMNKVNKEHGQEEPLVLGVGGGVNSEESQIRPRMEIFTMEMAPT